MRESLKSLEKKEVRKEKRREGNEEKVWQNRDLKRKCNKRVIEKGSERELPFGAKIWCLRVFLGRNWARK